ncbi:WGR domain-containing protein [Herbaspirillum sp. RV1423]|uniref:WGR domain-containing protein n=1 Tax=Herbaspirillum sp. RV1423 TaxID=1443993 RepID=UPI0004B36F1F|nr:WGR domain-containing protein [Herbaspirillum sp. RV1423]
MIDSADNVTHMLPVTGPMRLNFFTEQPDAARIFIADLTQDLLGDWIVTQSWTGKPQARGGGRVTVVSDQEAGFKMIQKIAQKKEKSGYRLI